MTGTSLKFLMMFLMVLDHISPFISGELAAVFHFLSRPVAPVFAFLAVEAFVHTRSREAYLSRLFIAAGLMGLGNRLLNHFFIADASLAIHNNIFFSLGLGVLLLYVLERFRGRRLVSFLAYFLIFALSLGAEGGPFIPLFILVTYIFRDRPSLRNRIYIFSSLLFALGVWESLGTFRESIFLFFRNSDAIFALMGLPFIASYNGKRGRTGQFSKYFFYLFYPAHIWLIGLLAARL